MAGIGSHERRVADAAACSPSARDLQPRPMCASPAPLGYTAQDNGLQKPWHGRVWLNPPYGLEAAQWLARLAAHGAGTALIFARTETEMFFENVWSKASALLFLKGRLHFHYVDGRRAAANGGAPSVLIAYGEQDAEILKTCGLPGAFVPLTAQRAAQAAQGGEQ